MAYNITQSEKDTGGDSPNSIYEWIGSPNVYVIKEKTTSADIAYGILDPTSNYLNSDSDVYSFGELSPGVYEVDVDDYQWNYNALDTYNVTSYKLLNQYGFIVASKYDTYSNLEFTVENIETFYLQIEGMYNQAAQYSASLEKIDQIDQGGQGGQNAPAQFNFNLLHVGDSFIPGEEFKIDPTSFVSDADGTSQLGAGTWAWYRHNASSVDASSEVYAIGGASFTNYFASDEDVGYYVSLKFEFTDDAGNDEFIYLTSDSPIAEAPNSEANFNIYLDSGEYSVGETVLINFTVSDTDGHDAISESNYSITW